MWGNMKTKQKELQDYVLGVLQTNIKIAELTLKAVTQKFSDLNQGK